MRWLSMYQYQVGVSLKIVVFNKACEVEGEQVLVNIDSLKELDLEADAKPLHLRLHPSLY